MTLISRILSRKKGGEKPDLQFGRYCDSYKSVEQMKFWEQAVLLYSKEKYLESFENLLQYLKDPILENVSWTQSNGKLHFRILQGSKVIHGEITAIQGIIKAVIAKFKKKNIAWMRILLEENYHLEYARFAISHDDEIILVFDTFMEEALPHKMYEALRELSIRADKIDDILLSDNEDLEPVFNDHIKWLDENIIESKYRFFKKNVDAVFFLIDHPSSKMLSFSGSYMYLILACAYKLDYLIKPEGSLMKCIEQCHRRYFNDQAEDIDFKTQILIQNFKEILLIPEKKLKDELYDSRSTFGLDLPVGVQGLLEIIDAQWNDLGWFLENDYMEIHRFVCDYIVGFSLFSFALPLPYQRLLHLYYQITEHEYFLEIGFQITYIKQSKLNKKEILREIQAIKVLNSVSGQPFHPDTTVLRYENITIFCHSFLFMIKNTIIADS